MSKKHIILHLLFKVRLSLFGGTHGTMVIILGSFRSSIPG